MHPGFLPWTTPPLRDLPPPRTPFWSLYMQVQDLCRSSTLLPLFSQRSQQSGTRS